MEENFKNKIGLTLFILVILFLLIGGYFFTKYVLTDHKEKEYIKKHNVNYKIDKNKEFIYYENDSVLSESAEIDARDVVINIKGGEVLTESLNRETKMYKENIQYITDQQLLTDEVIHYNNDNIFSMTFRVYKEYISNKYASLIVYDYDYSAIDNIKIKEIKAYTFNTSKGKRVTSDELLNEFEISVDDVKNAVSNFLKQKQESSTESDVIYNIEETLNNININNLFVNEFNKISISYIVKTNQVDYNEVTEV